MLPYLQYSSYFLIITSSRMNTLAVSAVRSVDAASPQLPASLVQFALPSTALRVLPSGGFPSSETGPFLPASQGPCGWGAQASVTGMAAC